MSSLSISKLLRSILDVAESTWQTLRTMILCSADSLPVVVGPHSYPQSVLWRNTVSPSPSPPETCSCLRSPRARTAISYAEFPLHLPCKISLLIPVLFAIQWVTLTVFHLNFSLHLSSQPWRPTTEPRWESQKNSPAVYSWINMQSFFVLYREFSLCTNSHSINTLEVV